MRAVRQEDSHISPVAAQAVPPAFCLVVSVWTMGSLRDFGGVLAQKVVLMTCAKIALCPRVQLTTPAHQNAIFVTQSTENGKPDTAN